MTWRILRVGSQALAASNEANLRTTPTTREIQEVSRGKLAKTGRNETGLAPPDGAGRLALTARRSWSIVRPVLLFWIVVGVAVFAVFSAVVALALGRMIAELSRSLGGTLRA